MAVPLLLPAVSEVFVVIAKRAYQPLVNDNDQVLIENRGALRLGLQALLKEDADDQTRADILWAKAIKLLATEEDNSVGAGAQGTISVADDFGMECIPFGL